MSAAHEITNVMWSSDAAPGDVAKYGVSQWRAWVDTADGLTSIVDVSRRAGSRMWVAERKGDTGPAGAGLTRMAAVEDLMATLEGEVSA
jgi:hypothetical protein